MTAVAQSHEQAPSQPQSSSAPPSGGGVQLKSALRGSDLDVQMSMLHPVQRHTPEQQGAGIAHVGQSGQSGPAAVQARAGGQGAPVQRRERAVQRMVVQREGSGTPPAAPPAPPTQAPAPGAAPTTGGANTTTADGANAGANAPGADPAAAEQARKQQELQLKEAQIEELLAAMKQHCAQARTKWAAVKTGWSGFTALVGGPIIATSAKVGALAGTAIGGPLGAPIGAVIGAGAGLLGTIIGNNKVSKVIEQQTSDQVDNELLRIANALDTGLVDIDITLAIDLIREDASNVQWIYEHVQRLAVQAEEAKALETQTQAEIDKKKAEEAAQQGSSAAETVGNASDVVGNTSDTAGGILEAAKETLGSLSSLGPVLDTVGNGADVIGVAIEAGRTAVEANTWRQAKNALPGARAEVDRLRAELGMPPLTTPGGGS